MSDNSAANKATGGKDAKEEDGDKKQPPQAPPADNLGLNRHLLEHPQGSNDAILALQLNAAARQQQQQLAGLMDSLSSPPQESSRILGQQSLSTADLQQLLTAQAVLNQQRQQQQQQQQQQERLIASAFASRQPSLSQQQQQQQDSFATLLNSSSDAALIRALQQGQQQSQHHHPFTGLASAEETARLVQQSRSAEETLRLAQQQAQAAAGGGESSLASLDTQRLLNLLSSLPSPDRGNSVTASEFARIQADRIRAAAILQQQPPRQQQVALTGVGGQTRSTVPSLQHILPSSSSAQGLIGGNAGGLGSSSAVGGNLGLLAPSLTAQQSSSLLDPSMAATRSSGSNDAGLLVGLQHGTLSSLEQLLGRSAARLPINPSLLLPGAAASSVATGGSTTGAVPFPFSSTVMPAPSGAAGMSDESKIKDESDPSLPQRKKRAYRHVSFPEKLHSLLCDVEDEGKDHIVSWINSGLALQIHKTEAFEQEILPKYFRHGKVSSFHRQLLLYGFTRIKEGRGRGGFQHQLFRRDWPHRLKDIQRIDY